MKAPKNLMGKKAKRASKLKLSSSPFDSKMPVNTNQLPRGEYRPHCVWSVLTTSAKILQYRPPARL